MQCGSVAMLVLTLGAVACSKSEHSEPRPTEMASPAAESPKAAKTPADTATGASPDTASASPAAASALPLAPAKLSALGTEPFWNAQIDGPTLTYTTPEDQSGQRIAVERRDTAIGAVFSGTLGGAPLVLTVTQHTCSDGMSDRAYPLRTVLTIGSQRRIGCASYAAAARMP